MTALTPDRPDLTRDQFTNDESYYLATGRRVTRTLTPEQMRALADEVLERVAADRDGDLDFADRIMTALRAAADEVDRLREANEESEAARSAAAAYGDRLRAVIENAPHQRDCWLLEYPDEGVLPSHRCCTCWKADAL